MIRLRMQGLPSWVVPAALLLSAIFLLGWFSTEVGDTDFWWHLKTGQFIVERHSLPVPDPFAYTTSLNPTSYAGEDQVRHFNLTHEWLSQVVLYLAYAAGGIPAVVLLRSLVLMLLCALVGFVAARRTENPFVGIVAAFATASIAVYFTADRPALLSFLFVALFIAILETRKVLWALPVLAVLWANSHGGFFMGWVVLGAYCIELRPVPEDRKQLWIVSACAVLLSGLNPNGFGIVSTLFRYRDSPLTSTLVEWHSPYLLGPPYGFGILLIVGVVVLAMAWQRARISDAALFLAFGVAALVAYRNIVFLGIIAPIVIASYFPWKLKMPKITPWVVTAALLAGIGFGIARGYFFQLRVAPAKFPAGAADYLAKNRPSGALLNTYEHGGYLIWRLGPAQKVFIDGRALSEATYRDYLQLLYNSDAGTALIDGARARLLDRYGIDTVVMNSFEFINGAFYPLGVALADPAHPEWQLVYQDNESVVFRRNAPAGTMVYPNKLQQTVDHIERECAAHVAAYPDQPACARSFADFCMRAGDKVRARRVLSLYLAHAPEKDPEAEAAMQTLSQP